MRGTATSWGAYRLLCAAATASALLLACSVSHEPNAGTSGSNWLRCKQARDCGSAPNAVACNADGYCVDAQGQRIAVDVASEDPATTRSAAALESCPWGMDALLVAAGAGLDTAGRLNCGHYAPDDRFGMQGGIACFASAFERASPVEITVDECLDCNRAVTIVAVGTDVGFLVRHDAGASDEALRQVSVSECSQVHVELERPANLDPDEPGDWPFVGCAYAVERYRCSQPVDEPLAYAPVTPIKLADVEGRDNVARQTLHLLMSNGSSSEPLVPIDVFIDDVHVVTGDFEAGGEAQVRQFDVSIPNGERAFTAIGPEADELLQTLDLSQEMWITLRYKGGSRGDSSNFSFWYTFDPVELP